MIIKEHNAEANLLSRRLELLHILDDIVRSGVNLGDLQDNPEFDRLEREFAEVAEATDLIVGIRAIYAETGQCETPDFP